MKQETLEKENKEEQTIALIKPDGIERSLTIECIRRIQEAGLEITQKKMLWMSQELAEEFRREIKEKHPAIFNSLIEYMTEGPCIALLVEGNNAIKKLRKLCGATNPREAERGTIRGDYGDKSKDMKELYKKGKVIKNIIHASENKEEAEREIELIMGIQKEMEVAA